MQTHQWNDHIRIVVSEMSHKQHFACSAALNKFIQTVNPAELEAFDYWKAIVGVLIPFSRVEVYRDNVKLPEGQHDIDGACITLPVTVECLDELPATLAMFLINATASENRVTLENFTSGIVTRTETLSERLSVSTP
jgi:hypothetical protein